MGVLNPLMVTAMKAASDLSNSTGHLRWRKRGWTQVPPLRPPQELSFLRDFDSKLLLSPQARGSLDQQQHAKVMH